MTNALGTGIHQEHLCLTSSIQVGYQPTESNKRSEASKMPLVKEFLESFIIEIVFDVCFQP